MKEFKNFEVEATFVTKKPMKELSWLSTDAITVLGSDGEEYIFDTITFEGGHEKLKDGRCRYEISKYNADHEYNKDSNEGRSLKWEAIRDGIWEEFFIVGDITPEEPESFGNEDLLFEKVTIYLLDDDYHEVDKHTLTEKQLKILNSQNTKVNSDDLEDTYLVSLYENELIVHNLSVPDSSTIDKNDFPNGNLKVSFEKKDWPAFIVGLIEEGYLN